MELGCFLAGSIISAGGDNMASKVEHLVTPIKDFLSSIFFTAIGKCIGLFPDCDLHSESAHSVTCTQRVHSLLSALKKYALSCLFSESAHSAICTQRVHTLLSALKECTLCYLHSESMH